jgi:hypothetical protein
LLYSSASARLKNHFPVHCRERWFVWAANIFIKRQKNKELRHFSKEKLACGRSDGLGLKAGLSWRQ